MRMINAIRHFAYSRSPGCQMWYQRVIEMYPPKFASMTVQDLQLSTSIWKKRQWVDDDELDDRPAQFRRVRLRCGRELPDQRNMKHTYSILEACRYTIDLTPVVDELLDSKYKWCVRTVTYGCSLQWDCSLVGLMI